MKINRVISPSSIIGVFLMLSLLFPNQASAKVTSTFDSDLEGWTGLGCSVVWDQANGNPGPCLRCSDIRASGAEIAAPANFLGQWPRNGRVSADIRWAGTGTYPIINPVTFVITDGNTTYQCIFPTMPTTDWQRFQIELQMSMTEINQQWTLVASILQWFYQLYLAIGKEIMPQVLQNVTGFYIRTDYVEDPNTSNNILLVDNIKILPATTGPINLLLVD